MRLFKVKQERWENLELEYGTLPCITSDICEYIKAATLEEAVEKGRKTLQPGFILSDVTMERYLIPREV